MLLFFFGLFPLFIGLKKITSSWFVPFNVVLTPTYLTTLYFWIPLISTKSYFSLFSVKNGFKKYWYVMEVLIYIKYIKKLIVKNAINVFCYTSLNSIFCKFSKYFVRLTFSKSLGLEFFKFFFYLKRSFSLHLQINLCLNMGLTIYLLISYRTPIKITALVFKKSLLPFVQIFKNFLTIRFNLIFFFFKYFPIASLKYTFFEKKKFFLFFLLHFKQFSFFLKNFPRFFNKCQKLMFLMKRLLPKYFKMGVRQKVWSSLFLKKNKFFKIFLSKKYLKFGRKRRFFYKKFFFHKKKKTFVKKNPNCFTKLRSGSKLSSTSKIKKTAVSLKLVPFQNLLNGFFFNQFFFFHTPLILKTAASFFNQHKKTHLIALKKNFFFLLVNFFKSFLFKNLSFFVNRDIFLKKFLKTCFLCYKQFIKKYWRFLKIPKLLKKVFFALIFFFIYKNITFLKKTLKSLITMLNFKKQKKLFYFFRYLVGTFLKVFYKSFCIEGFMVMFKGKFSTLVGGRKKIFKCFFSKISSTKYLCYFKWVNIKTTTKLGVTNIKILCTFL